MLETTTEKTKERARGMAEEKADDVWAELGRLVFEILEEYFPEEAKARRQQNQMQILFVGIVIGFLLRHSISRRGRTE